MSIFQFVLLCQFSFLFEIAVALLFLFRLKLKFGLFKPIFPTRAAPPHAADLSQGVEPGERVVQQQRLELGLGEASNGRRGLLIFFFSAMKAESLGTKMVMPALVLSAWLWKVSMTLVFCR